MVDGLHINPIDEVRPAPSRETRGRDPAAGSTHSGGSSAAVAHPGAGPPAPDPSTHSGAYEENSERDSNRRRLNADEKESKDQSAKRAALLPGDNGSGSKQLAIRVDQDTGRAIFEVREKESGEVIRQIPSEEMMELAKKIPDLVQGMLIDITY